MSKHDAKRIYSERGYYEYPIKANVIIVITVELYQTFCEYTPVFILRTKTFVEQYGDEFEIDEFENTDEWEIMTTISLSKAIRWAIDKFDDKKAVVRYELRRQGFDVV